MSNIPLNKSFNQDYVRVLFWNCRVCYHWIIFIYCPKNWHKHWFCSWTPFSRLTTTIVDLYFHDFYPWIFLSIFFVSIRFCLKKYLFSPKMLVKFGRVLLLGKSKATFSSLQEASINLVSLEELCHQGGARSRFPTFRKRLSVLVKFVRPLSPGC